MKPTFYCSLLVAGLVLGCRDDESAPVPPPEEPVIFVTIDANVSDFPPDYSLNARRAEGELHVEENYFIELPTNRFALSSGIFSVDYGREVIQESRINQYSMCKNSFNDCEDLKWPIASLWQWVGSLSATDTLVWQYLDGDDPTQGYRWVMTEKPQQIQVVSAPAVLRSGQPQVISFIKASDEDHLKLELVVVEKEKLGEENTIPFVAHTRFLYDSSIWVEETNRVTLPIEQVDQLFSGRFALAETDTAFWNVASVRKIVKEINSVRFELTYQVNNLSPIRIELE